MPYVNKLPRPEPGKFRCGHPREGANIYRPPKHPNTETCRQCRIDRAAAARAALKRPQELAA